jgi:hypothetical protein
MHDNQSVCSEICVCSLIDFTIDVTVYAKLRHLWFMLLRGAFDGNTNPLGSTCIEKTGFNAV